MLEILSVSIGIEEDFDAIVQPERSIVSCDICCDKVHVWFVAFACDVEERFICKYLELGLRLWGSACVDCEVGCLCCGVPAWVVKFAVDLR